MTKDVISTSTDTSLKNASILMTSKSVSSLVVVENSKPIAILSERDIIRGVITGKKNVKGAMSNDFKIISPKENFFEVARSLREKKVSRFPVVENEKLVGLVTETDIIEAERDFTRFHQIMQEVILAIFGLATAFFLFYFSPLKATILGLW